MNELEPQAMVLRDREGNYYLFSLDMLERARIPDERREEFVESIGGDDVAGFGEGVAGGVTKVEARYIVDEVSEPLPVATHREGFVRSAWRAFRATRV